MRKSNEKKTKLTKNCSASTKSNESNCTNNSCGSKCTKNKSND